MIDFLDTRLKLLLVAFAMFAIPLGCSSSKSSSDNDGGPDAGDDSGTDETYQGEWGDPGFFGPWGGAATRIVEDPSFAGRVYAAVSGALFLSTDQGNTWAAVEVDSEWNVGGLLVMNDGTVFVGTEFEVLRSTDQGSTWTDIRGNMEAGLSFNISVEGIAYVSGSPGALWVALAGSYNTAPVWFLEDGSTTWQPWSAPTGWDTDPLNGSAHFTDLEIAMDTTSSELVIFAPYEMDFAAGGGVLCSTDSGATFEDCSSGLPSVPFHRALYHDGTVILAGGEIFGSAYAGIYYSEDLGSTWTLSNGGWSNPIANDIFVTSGGTFLAAAYGSGLMTTGDLTGTWTAQGGFGDMSLNSAVELANGHILVGPEQFGVQRSEDDGTTFFASSEGLDKISIEDAAQNPANTQGFLGSTNSQNSGLVLHTSSGADGWEVIQTDGFPRFSGVSIAPSGNWYVISDGPTGQANDGIYVSKDQGQTFQFLGPKDGDSMDHDNIIVLENGDEDHLVAAGNIWVGPPFISASNDGGASWEDLWTGDEELGASMGAFGLSPSGHMLLAASGESIVKVDAEGSAQVISVDGIAAGQVIELGICRALENVLYAVGMPSEESWDTALFVTDDGGESFSPVPLTGFAEEMPLYVEAHPMDCSVVFVVTRTGMLLASSDGGGSWEEISTPLESILGARTTYSDGGTDSSLVLFGSGGVVSLPLTAQLI